MSVTTERPAAAVIEDTTLVDTSCSATINAPIEKVDIPSWCFSLPDSEYQACSRAHYAAGATTAPDGRRMSINVEVVGGTVIVQHYVEDIAEPDHLRLVSHSDLFTPTGRTKIDVTWELSVTNIDDHSCELTNRFHSSARLRCSTSWPGKGLRSTPSGSPAGPTPRLTTGMRHRASPRASSVTPRRGSRSDDLMTELSYDREITALLVIDPYNDFISEGGLVWDRLRGVAEANNCIPHMQEILGASRQAGLRVCYALHHRYRTGDYETWKYIAPIQKANWRAKSFEYGTWRGEIRSEFGPLPGDIVACEHWCSSGFANTDLDQQLKTHGIHRLIIIGLIANTCVEATARFGAEFGYDVTVVKDATASFSEEEMHAALDINLPNYVNAIVTTGEIVEAISSLPANSSDSSIHAAR